MTLQFLVLPTRHTRNIDLFLKVCFWLDVRVLRVKDGEYLLPKECSLENTAVHGGTSFCRKTADALNASVAEPDDGFLPGLPDEYLNRTIRLIGMREARSLLEPKFIKPVNDKYFPASVYSSGAALPAEARLTESMVLVSDPVYWESEHRMFVLDHQVKASSPYPSQENISFPEGRHEQAKAFCERVLKDTRVRLPRAVVLDVGYIRGVGWAVVEANTAVMSSIYDSDPVAVLKVLRCGLLPR